MLFTKKQIMILAGGLVVLLLFGTLIYFNLRKRNAPPLVTLKIWGTESDKVMEGVIKAYNQLRPNVTVKYQSFLPNEYEQKVIDALASGAGPDVMQISSGAVSRMLNKLSPLESTAYTPANLGQDFPVVVTEDFVRDGKIYALPLYIDTLALLYNRSYLDQAALTSPPQSWEEFQNYLPYLIRKNEANQITRAGAAIGGGNSNVRYADGLLNLLLLQNGASMLSNDKRQAVFASGKGSEALAFYTQYANSASSYYTWNDEMPDSLQALADGKAAMAFGYYSDYRAIKEKNPYAEISLATMPQVSGDHIVNWSDYAGFAVSKQSKVSAWAWDYIQVTTAYPDYSKIYLQSANHPAALRTLINQTINDPALGVFAKQALTARSWERTNDLKSRDILNSSIRSVLSGESSEQAIRRAQDQVTQLIKTSQ